MNNSMYLTLNNGSKMPVLGLGVYQIEEDTQVEKSVLKALEYGYRLIDTASVYKNEAGVGRAIHASHLKREELFITTKVWNNAQRVGDVSGAFERSLERLQLDYVDLYLIHWPVSGCYVNTWQELIKINESGRARAIGVSNFNIHHIEDLIQTSEVRPAVNQFEFHPYMNQQELLDYCRANQIVVQACSPLARGSYFNNPIILEIAEKYQKSPAQIGLRWAIEKGVSVIPKSATEEHLIENSQVFDFELNYEDMILIDCENINMRINSDPEEFNF